MPFLGMDPLSTGPKVEWDGRCLGLGPREDGGGAVTTMTLSLTSLSTSMGVAKEPPGYGSDDLVTSSKGPIEDGS